MSPYLIRNSAGFPLGYTAITRHDDVEHNTGINFGILKLAANQEIQISSPLESAYLLLQGECEFQHDTTTLTVKRESYFDEDPFALHCPPHAKARIKALTDCEFAVSETANSNTFPTQIYTPDNMLESEHRGKGLLNDTAYRIVRTIFDTRNNPLSKLVLGEVITAPGRWSSYPPHHHQQPEIYHYRFTEPQGFGMSECGEQVFKVRQFDTYKIVDENDHAQAAAPGYGMYYIWVIRHLDATPYVMPTFTAEHEWARTSAANNRVWQGKF